MRIAACALGFVSVLSFAVPALAHIELLGPTAREDEQKQGPCGRDGSTRGDSVTVARSGSVLKVTWRESVNHPSHFRISFDNDGDDDFVDPKSAADRFTNETVLIDGISDQGGGVFSADVMLPDIECDNCTLQLIQVMYDKAPYVVGTNDVYYRCADLTLKRDAPPPDDPATGEDPGDPEGTDAGPGGEGPTTNHDPSEHTDGQEQDENAATAAPEGNHDAAEAGEKEPISGQSSLCSASGGADGSSAWALALGILYVFLAARRQHAHGLSLVMSKSRRRC